MYVLGPLSEDSFPYPQGTEEWYRHFWGRASALPTYEMLELQDESSFEHPASGPSAPESSSQKQQEKDDEEPPSMEKNDQKRDFWGLKCHFEKERLRSQPAPQPRKLKIVSYHQGNHYAVPLRNEFQTAREVQAMAARRRSSLVLDDDEDKEWITVKCTCSRTSDDGNMVYCEDCDTWQHMKCYYPGQAQANRMAEGERALEHCCADCKPRPLERVESERWELVNPPMSS